MRQLLKSVGRLITGAWVLPRVGMFRLASAILGPNRALQGATQSLARIGGLHGEYLRRAFLSRTILRCDPTATVCYGTIFSSTAARIDAFVYVGARCHLGLVHLERDVLLGDGVQVPSGAHIHGTEDVLVPIREQAGRAELVRIGEGTWVGSGAIILADVGRHCVIGAGSVVIKPLPDFVVAAGVPARVIRQRRGGSPPIESA
ncbi:MAG: acyltransferase [Vicinamibacterales bacterium]